MKAGRLRILAALLLAAALLSGLAAPAFGLEEGPTEESAPASGIASEPLPADDEPEAPLPEAEPAPAEDGFPAALPQPALTGLQSEDTARIALSQVGYTAAGGTVYGNWWQKYTGYFWRDYTHTEWCGVFAAWCAYQAGAGMNKAFDRNAAVAQDLFDWLRAHGGSDTEFREAPRPGDFVFFAYGTGKASHVVVVTAYDPDTGLITYVGGNQSNPELTGGGTKTDGRVVSQKTIEWSPAARDAAGRGILGWGRPNYNDAPHITARPDAAAILRSAVGLAATREECPPEAAALLRRYA